MSYDPVAEINKTVKTCPMNITIHTQNEDAAKVRNTVCNSLNKL